MSHFGTNPSADHGGVISKPTLYFVVYMRQSKLDDITLIYFIVTEVADINEILKERESVLKLTPYFVAYMRQDKLDTISVPICR